MAPRKKGPSEPPPEQRRITNFFCSPGKPVIKASRAGSAAASVPAQTASTAGAGAATSAATAGASSAGTAAAAQGRTAAAARAGASTAASGQHASAQRAAVRSTAVSTVRTPAAPQLSSTALVLTQQLQQAVEHVAAGNEHALTTARFSRAAKSALGEQDGPVSDEDIPAELLDMLDNWPTQPRQEQQQQQHDGVSRPQQQQQQGAQAGQPGLPAPQPAAGQAQHNQQPQQPVPWVRQQQPLQQGPVPWPPAQQQQQSATWPPQQPQQPTVWPPQQPQQQQAPPWPAQQQQQVPPWPPQQQGQRHWPPHQQQQQGRHGQQQQQQQQGWQHNHQQQHPHQQQQHQGPRQQHHQQHGRPYYHRPPRQVSQQICREQAAVRAALCAAYLQVECFLRLNDQQKAAAMGDIYRALLILAGAGTGKTSTLIARVLFMLSQGVPPHRIMLVTFTNKAAGELKARLFSNFLEAINKAQQQLRRQGWQVELPVPEGPEQLGVMACTFHSWCYRVLGTRWRAAGFHQCPLVWDDKAARQAVRLAIRLADLDKVLSLLAKWLGAPEQTWPAVQQAAREKQPALMRKWQQKLLADKQKAEEAAEKKRKKAAGQASKSKPQGTKRKAGAPGGPLADGQMRMDQFSRQAKQSKTQEGAVNQQQQHPEVGLSNGDAQGQQQQQQQAEVVHSNGNVQGQQQQQQQDGAGDMPPPAPVQPQPQQQQLLLQQQNGVEGHADDAQDPAAAAADGDGGAASALGGLQQQELQIEAKLHLYELMKGRYDLDNEGKSVKDLAKKPSMTYVKQVQKVIDSAKCKGERPEDYLEGQAAVMQHYQNLLRLCNAVDFNDLLDHCVRIFTGTPAILEQEQRKRPFLLVDEFQDSNKPQTDLVNLLQGRMQHVTVVGDDAQSIYRFRGAQPGIFEAYKAAYSHQHLVRPLELNYRSTPQILAVGKALLAGSNTMEKQLTPTISGEGKPPVRMLVVDTEEDEGAMIAKEAKEFHEQQGVPYKEMAVLFRAFNFGSSKAHTHLQKALTREGVPFVIVKDVSLMERQEVKDVMAYIRLALNPSDDDAFKRVINVPARRLGKTLLDKLDAEKYEALVAAGNLGHNQLQQQQRLAGQRQQQYSFFSIAGRMLEQGLVAAINHKGLTAFLAVVEEMSGIAVGASVPELVEMVLEKVPGLAACIRERKQRKKGKRGPKAEDREQQDEGPEEEAAEEGQEGAATAAAAGAGGHGGTGPAAGKASHKQRPKKQQAGSSAAPAFAGAGAGSGSSCGGYASARVVYEQQQSQQTSSAATAATGATAATWGAESEDEDDEDDESSDGGDESSDDESSSELVEDAPIGAAVVKPDVVKITPALSAFYDKAVAFSQQYAASHGARSRQPGSRSSSGAQPPPPPPAAGAGAATGQDAAAEEGTQEPPVQEPLGPPTLFELMSQEVTSRWSSVELLRAGVPRFLLEEIYAAMGKGERVVSEFVSHLALNPHSEVQHGSSQSQQGALTISTIHAAKGLEYNTCWVARWCEGFLPTHVRKAELARCEGKPEEMHAMQEEHRREEQRLAHVAVTRAKERLILIRPCFKYLPKGLAEATPDQLQDLLNDPRTVAGLRELSIASSSFLQLIRGAGLHRDASVYVEEDHCTLGLDTISGGVDLDR